MSSSSQKTPQRGWFEGTLDVISGMAHRPSTPTPQFRHGGTLSAPNSPMRKDAPGHNASSSSAGGAGAGAGMAIHRLPSQDSLDRSIHNDSGHGNKSTAQIIRDLKQSNARLTARTAALEADFMNQLNAVTRQYEEKQQTLEETLLKSEKLTSSLEHRCQVAEAKSKEKEESLQRVREESAFQRHTISDLRTQLDWAENKDSQSEWFQEKDKLLRELRLVKEEAKLEMEEKEQLKQQMAALRRGEGDDANMAEALRQTQATLEQVREEGEKQQVEHEKQVSFWKEQLDKVQQNAPFAITEKEEKRADSPSVMQQFEETKRALDATRKELEKVKKQAQHQEQYRQEEADDLRLLNDAQEEELERLRKDLDNAVKDLEQRDQELDEQRNQQFGGDSVAKESLEKLEKALEETKEAKEEEIRHLVQRADELEDENQRLQNVIQMTSNSAASDFDKQAMIALRAKNASLEERNASLEKSMDKMKVKLVAAEQAPDSTEEQERLESSYQAKLISKETELEKLKEQLSTSIDKAKGENGRVLEMSEEVERLKKELEEANGKLKKATTRSLKNCKATSTAAN